MTPIGVSGFTTLPSTPIMPSRPVNGFLWKIGITATCIMKTKVPTSSAITIIVGRGSRISRNCRTSMTSTATPASSSSKTKTLNQSPRALFIGFILNILCIEPIVYGGK